MKKAVEHVERIFGPPVSISSETGFTATVKPKSIRRYAL
jgi:hypothetical protein